MEEEKLYTIKEFSALTDVSTDTLRYYDKIGLFSPSRRDEKNGYRYYTLNEFERIGEIQTLQQLGLSLDEIKTFMSDKTFLSSYKLLKRQYEHICGKIDELKLLKSYLGEKLAHIDNIISGQLSENISVRYFPARTGYCSDRNCHDYSQIKSESARIIEKYDKNLFISSSYALYIPENELHSGEYRNNYYCVILDITKDKNTKFRKIEFPAGEYVICRYAGTSFDRNKTIEKLLDYISDNGYEVCGDALQLCVIDENLTNIDSEKINEIQIAVRRAEKSDI